MTILFLAHPGSPGVSPAVQPLLDATSYRVATIFLRSLSA